MKRFLVIFIILLFLLSSCEDYITDPEIDIVVTIANNAYWKHKTKIATPLPSNTNTLVPTIANTATQIPTSISTKTQRPTITKVLRQLNILLKPIPLHLHYFQLLL